MDLALAWLVFPALLLAVCCGCGLLLAGAVCGRGPPPALIPACGLAVIVCVGQLLTLADATAELAAPLVVLLALVGVGLSLRLRPERGLLAAIGTALAAFAAFAAPIVLSGEATFAGYIKLDDTATWMALTDRVMEHGRSLDGLAPSTYEATLAFNLGDGYPIGAFLPLGVATLLSGQDVAWTIQPYMAFLGVLLALGLWQIAGSLIASPRLRALAAFVGSQSALLYGYYLWGGMKEIAAASLLATAAALAGHAVATRGEPRALVALALVCAALIGVLSAGGALWLAPPLAAALMLLAARLGAARALRSATLCAGLVAVLALPVLVTGGVLPPTSSPLTDADARGNLIAPLELFRIAGIWPSGDFRLDPDDVAPAYVLIAVATAVAIGTVAVAWRRRAWAVALYVGGTLAACLAIFAVGSPWVDGKALATASPAIPFAAALGAAALYAGGRRVEGAVLMLAVAGGVLWSNALQYRDVNLAPRDQLAELEEIGEQIAGQGPTLMTEYQPYGARHFLRDADPEAASELRRREVPLIGGGSLAKGEHADTDRLALEGLHDYRTLVLRRGPGQSRPPSPYGLVWRGDYYEVWQRPQPGSAPVRHLGLGGAVNPVAAPRCGEVGELAELAGPDGVLLAASRPPVVTASPAAGSYPSAWAEAGSPDRPLPVTAGDLTVPVRVPRRGAYEVWLGGSVRPEAGLIIDGRASGSVRHLLNNAGLFVRLGEARLEAGEHAITVRFDGAGIRPGSGGSPPSIGPLVLSDSDAAEARITRVGAEGAERRLCGRAWDWIEIPGG